MGREEYEHKLPLPQKYAAKFFAFEGSAGFGTPRAVEDEPHPGKKPFLPVVCHWEGRNRAT